MAYTGQDYFLQVKLSDNTNSKVRDADIDAAMQTQGAILTSHGTSNGLANFTTILPGTTNQILAMGSAGLPIWTSASAAAGVNDADLNIKLNNANATKLFSANSNTAAELSFASGSANGSIAVNGTNVSVTGLKSAAFQETSAFDAAGAAATAEQNAKNYADGLISGLGSVMGVKGTTTTVPTSTTGNETGDVWIISNPGNEHDGEEYVWTGSAWEMMGKNDIDLSGYVAKSDVVPSVTSGVALATISGKTIYAPAAAAQQQADWAQATTTSVTFIKNKPDLSVYAKTTDLSDYVTKDSVIPGVTSGISLGTVGGTTIYMPSAASLSSTLGLKGLAFKDNVSVPANTFVTGITSTGTDTSSIRVVASAASSITSYTAGTQAAFEVNDGVLSLVGGAPTSISYSAVNPTDITINHKTQSATKNSAMTLS